VKPATPHIILNGQVNTPEAISEKLRIKILPDWEKDLYLFLSEWFSDSDFILAKTSGSTGESKTIELSKSVMIKSAERTIEYFGLKKDDRLLLSLPCQYIAGKMMVVRAIVGQMNLITTNPSGDFDFLQTESFDFGAMVPNQVLKILGQPSGKGKLQNIRNLLIGGSGISADLESQINELSNRVVITYGMTETASHIAIRELSGNRNSEFYHCLSGISVDLNETGCLRINHPEFLEPIQTSDLAELQSSTSFKILGRADSVIISGGIKYSPESIEKKLEGLFENRFVISSVPDEILGEKLVLVIEGESFDTSRDEQKIAEILTSFERPKAIVFLKYIPENQNGKIVRDEVRQLIANQK